MVTQKKEGSDDAPAAFTPEQEARLAEMMAAAVAGKPDDTKPNESKVDTPPDTTGLTQRQLEDLQEKVTRDAVLQLRDDIFGEKHDQEHRQLAQDRENKQPTAIGKVARFLFGDA